jgi:methionyl-tRNA formyltransferase
MQPSEAEFFRTLLAGSTPETAVCVQTLEELQLAVDAVGGRARLISFCSDLIVPGVILDQLKGDCFNFHSGPPERPGYRPAGFAASEHATSYGVTFHRMIAQIDAGPIYATRRFDIPSPSSEEEIGTLAYRELLWLAAEVTAGLANLNHPFQPTGETWGAIRTSKIEYDRLKR